MRLIAAALPVLVCGCMDSTTSSTRSALDGCELYEYPVQVDGLGYDGEYFYWMEWDGDPDYSTATIRRMPKAGGNTELLASGSFHLWRRPRAFAVDDQYVFWLSYDDPLQSHPNFTLLRIPKTGGAVVEMTDLPAQSVPPSSPVLDGDFVYWLDGSPEQSGTIHRMPKSGGDVEAFATGFFDVVELAANGDFFYISDYGTPLKMPKSGGPATSIEPNGILNAVHSFAFDDERIFLGDEEQGPAFVWKSNGQVVFLGGKDSRYRMTVWSLAADFNRVYWSGNHGYPSSLEYITVRSVAKDNTDEVIFTQSMATDNLIVDDDYVYWDFGKLYRYPKSCLPPPHDMAGLAPSPPDLASRPDLTALDQAAPPDMMNQTKDAQGLDLLDELDQARPEKNAASPASVPSYSFPDRPSEAVGSGCTVTAGQPSSGGSLLLTMVAVLQCLRRRQRNRPVSSAANR